MSDDDLAALLAARFGAPVAVPADLASLPALAGIAGRASCRRFEDRPVSTEWLEALCAVALSAPSKSDLQQRDIVIVDDPGALAALKSLLAGQGWIAGAPTLLVFCADNRRQRLLHEWSGHPFVNDHLDAFFNASVDAAIALATFVLAAEAAGLGVCPISAIRNEAAAVSDLLGLPDHVFPVAGLAVGHPAEAAPISPRLPLAVTVHRNRYREEGLREAVARYDDVRAAAADAPQRREDLFGRADRYGWSEDKARQYALPERAGFGRFVRGKGFDLG